jgi:hypothetical protein
MKFKILFLVQSNLCTTTTLGTPNLWPLLTGGRCSEVAFCYKDLNWDYKITVVVGRWSLFGGGRWLRFDCTSDKVGDYFRTYFKVKMFDDTRLEFY